MSEGILQRISGWFKQKSQVQTPSELSDPNSPTHLETGTAPDGLPRQDIPGQAPPAP